jgi:hypothetical protein
MATFRQFQFRDGDRASSPGPVEPGRDPGMRDARSIVALVHAQPREALRGRRAPVGPVHSWSSTAASPWVPPALDPHEPEEEEEPR